MEKEVVWTYTAQKDFWNNIAYLAENWPTSVLIDFERSLAKRVTLISKMPSIGFKSKQYSKFRKTLVGKHILLIYSITPKHIVIHRLKHATMR
jgi:plasmid stabilization system protein ParE